MRRETLQKVVLDQRPQPRLCSRTPMALYLRRAEVREQKPPAGHRELNSRHRDLCYRTFSRSQCGGRVRRTCSRAAFSHHSGSVVHFVPRNVFFHQFFILFSSGAFMPLTRRKSLVSVNDRDGEPSCRMLGEQEGCLPGGGVLCA